METVGAPVREVPLILVDPLEFGWQSRQWWQTQWGLSHRSFVEYYNNDAFVARFRHGRGMQYRYQVVFHWNM